MTAPALLKSDRVSIEFGGLKALSNFSLEIRKGDLKGLIGPNGAGKTTAFNAITGVYPPTSGEVFVSGYKVNLQRPYRINRLGIARTFQNIRLFRELPVIDNVRVALVAKTTPLFSAKRIEAFRKQGGVGALIGHGLDASNNYVDWWRALLLTPGFLREEDDITVEAESILDVMGLMHRRDEPAGSLPYGEQRRLEIARALATHPSVLLLDEPAAGMNSKEKVDLMALIRDLLVRFSLGILVIEHDMKLVMGICEDITVLDHGETIASGNPDEVRKNKKVIEAYLGDESSKGVQRTQRTIDAAPDFILQIKDLHVSYGAIKAVRGITFDVGRGEVVAIVGGNGAGKTSTLRALSGMLKPESGKIQLDGEDVTGMAAHTLVPTGMSHAPEGRGIFLNMSVEDNLRLGAYLRRDAKEIEQDLQYCFTLFPRIKERIRQIAGTLSGGELQMLAISRALMSRPRLLLLDEPSLGLAPQIVERIFQIIRDVNERGISILLVEQNAKLALSIAHRGFVFETGELVMSGTGQELLENDEVRKAYLGE